MAYTAAAQGAVSLAANLALWGALWLAIPLVGPTGDGALAPPVLALMALFTLAAFEAVAPLPQAFAHLGGIRAAARRLFEIVDAEPAVPVPAGPSPRPQGFDLTLAGVGFSYPQAAGRPWRGSISGSRREAGSPWSGPPAPARAPCST